MMVPKKTSARLPLFLLEASQEVWSNAVYESIAEGCTSILALAHLREQHAYSVAVLNLRSKAPS